MSSSPRAVAFDVFGTLCHGHASSGPYNDVRDYFRINPEQFRVAAMTRDLPLEDLVRELTGREDFSHDEVVELAKASEAVRTDCGHVRLFDDVKSTLSRLTEAAIPYGLISNLAYHYAEPVIALLRQENLLPPEELCLWSFREGVMKPDPIIFRRFCERVAIPPSEVLVVGDKERNDLVAPRTLGCQSRLLVRDGSIPPHHSISPLDIISTLDTVPRLLGLNIPSIDSVPEYPREMRDERGRTQ